MTRTSLALAATLALSACGDKDGDDTSASGTYSFSGGNFQFTTTAADDPCFDGAYEVLFLPDGPGSTNDWAYEIELPAWDALPATYDIQLQEPFSTMSVTVNAGAADGLMTIDGAEQTGVLLDNTDDGEDDDCTTDMDVDVEVTIDSEDAAHGSATLTLANLTGDDCAVPVADPCLLTLDFDAARVQ